MCDQLWGGALKFNLHHGDCIEVMRGMADASVDSIVCDPPYLLGFMGKAWDAADGIAGKPEVWREALRVLKPGGHLLAFGAPRTNHRMVTAIEDAGFEIRDQIMYIFGSGFPKSMNIGKAIDKAAGAVREVIGPNPHARPSDGQTFACMSAKGHDPFITAPATPAAQQWQGFGTALKPAYEPVCVARKPLDKSTVAANVLAHGCGGINIDGCRVACEGESLTGGGDSGSMSSGEAFDRPWKHCPEKVAQHGEKRKANALHAQALGRWPANIILDGSAEVAAIFPVTAPASNKPRNNGDFKSVAKGRELAHTTFGHNDNGGSAARFFYSAKAQKTDRNEGCEALPVKQYGHDGRSKPIENGYQRNDSVSVNHHATVKPTALMAYLCRLVTPPGGTVLDCFMGSGSTGKAAVMEGFNFIGIEQNAEYVEIARARIEFALRQHKQGQIDFDSETTPQPNKHLHSQLSIL